MSSEAAKLRQKLAIDTVAAAQKYADDHLEEVQCSVNRDGNIVPGRTADAIAVCTVRPTIEQKLDALKGTVLMLKRHQRRHGVIPGGKIESLLRSKVEKLVAEVVDLVKEG